MYLCDECRTLFLYESSLLFSTTRWLVRVCNLSLFLFFLFFVYMKCEPLGSFDFLSNPPVSVSRVRQSTSTFVMFAVWPLLAWLKRSGAFDEIRTILSQRTFRIFNVRKNHIKQKKKKSSKIIIRNN